MTYLPPLTRLQISIFLISSVMISYQILLVKMFSIQYWHHFSYFIISLALLGFGTSGSFILLFKKQLLRCFNLLLFIVPFFILLFVWINLYISNAIAFNPLMIVWQKKEIFRLVLLSIFILIPFFFGALCIGLSFTAAPKDAHKLYFANLSGSAAGGLVILLSVFHVTPYEIMLVISIILIVAAIAVSTGYTKKCIAFSVFVLMISLYYWICPPKTLIAMSPFKDLVQAERMMGSKKEMEMFGPLGHIAVVDTPAYHYLPDMSLNCPYSLPKQKALFWDGNLVGPIHSFNNNLDDFKFMDYRTNALAYKLVDNPDVLIIGGGSGTEIISARYHAAKSVSVVEMNPDIVNLMQGAYAEFSGDIYNPVHTNVFIEDGRGFLERTEKTFDIVHINLLEASGTVTGGLSSLHENYLFTTEAISASIESLNNGGIMFVSRWMRNPPKESIKMVATAIEALEKQGVKNPDQSIVVIRSWQIASIFVKKGVFEKEEIETVKAFSKSRLFDISYYPGIHEKETNIFNQMEKDEIYIATKQLLTPERESFYDTYPFHIRPATDDKPFFSHFLRIEMLKQYVKSFHRELIPFMDWGYILLWVTVCLLFIFGTLFIMAPIPIVLRSSKGLTSTFAYFGAIGLAYMLLEISIMQQFMRYLYDPVFSVTVVVSSFLFYSGLGSLIAGKFDREKSSYILWPVIAIGMAVFFLISIDFWLQEFISRQSLWARLLICSLLIAPLAGPMGALFPSGLAKLSAGKEELIPWAWGINCFLSVLGSTAAVLIAISFGFTFVIIIAVFLYILAAFFFGRLSNKPS